MLLNLKGEAVGLDEAAYRTLGDLTLARTLFRPSVRRPVRKPEGLTNIFGPRVSFTLIILTFRPAARRQKSLQAERLTVGR